MKERSNNRVRSGPLQFNPSSQHVSVKSDGVPDADAGNLLPSRPTLEKVLRERTELLAVAELAALLRVAEDTTRIDIIRTSFRIVWGRLPLVEGVRS
jgi:hypothetical protein